MAAAGEITPMPDGAIFADTQGEPWKVWPCTVIDGAPLTWGDGPPNAVGLWRGRQKADPSKTSACQVCQETLDAMANGLADWWSDWQWAGPYPEPQEPGETK